MGARKATAAVIATLCLLLVPEARADRMPIPDTRVCNKSKRKAKVARASWDTYVDWVSSGWTVLAPGDCAVVNADALYVSGNRKTTGLTTKVQQACVTRDAEFLVSIQTPDQKLADECARRGGNMVPFRWIDLRPTPSKGKGGKNKPPAVDILR